MNTDYFMEILKKDEKTYKKYKSILLSESSVFNKELLDVMHAEQSEKEIQKEAFFDYIKTEYT